MNPQDLVSFCTCASVCWSCVIFSNTRLSNTWADQHLQSPADSSITNSIAGLEETLQQRFEPFPLDSGLIRAYPPSSARWSLHWGPFKQLRVAFSCSSSTSSNANGSTWFTPLEPRACQRLQPQVRTFTKPHNHHTNLLLNQIRPLAVEHLCWCFVSCCCHEHIRPNNTWLQPSVSLSSSIFIQLLDLMHLLALLTSNQPSSTLLSCFLNLSSTHDRVPVHCIHHS